MSYLCRSLKHIHQSSHFLHVNVPLFHGLFTFQCYAVCRYECSVSECWPRRGLVKLNRFFEVIAVGAGGYGWIFPKGNHLSVGACARTRNFGHLKAYYHRLAIHHGLAGASVLSSRGHRLPLGVQGLPIYSGRALLAGDADGLVDWFTGEGIYCAVRTGKIAAAEIMRLLRGDMHDLAGYERRVDQELMPDLLAARRWLNFYLWVPALCYFLLCYSGRFWHAVCRVTRGELFYRNIAASLGPLSLLERLLPIAGRRNTGQHRRSCLR